MATLLSSFLFCFVAFLSLFCFVEKGCAYERQVTTESHHIQTVQVSSLIPSTTCSPSTEGPKKKGSLEVIHRYGPCSQLNGDKAAKVPTHTEILRQDESRVKSIQSRLSKSNNLSRDDLRNSEDFTLPTKSGSILGSGNYFVTVGLGSPKRDLSLIFDTGSDLTWTQCEPCSGSCYSQSEPIFDPTKSSTYSTVSCTSPSCSQLGSGTGYTPQCSASSECEYRQRYGDDSYSRGFYSKERLTITSSDVIEDFLFGCGQQNGGLFRGIAGLIGLGRDQISLVQQSATKYGRFFSYCLPSTSSSTGFLTFGKSGGVSNTVKFTPLVTLSKGPAFYGLDLVGISVGGSQLSIPTSAFSTAGTIIDSGTVITRLPPTAYTALRTAFRESMKNYPLTTGDSLMDTCYDFTNYESYSVPPISFLFGNGVSVDLENDGVVYVLSTSQVCLAFAGNRYESDTAIFGNVQQKRFEVVYDVDGERIGFAPGGCS